MISGINAAFSGLLVQQKKVDVAADNVANANTDDFKKSRVTLEEDKSTGVRIANIEKIDTPGPLLQKETTEGTEYVEGSNVNIVEDITTAMMSKRYFEANIKLIQTQDEMLGSLLDIKG